MAKHKLKLGFEGHHRVLSVTTPNDEPRPWDADTKLDVVGKRVPRIDGHLKVSGAARYTFDIALDGLLHGRVVRSPHPAATIKSIDVGPARNMPGVKAVMEIAKAGDRMIFVGQDVAAVAAERPEQALDAARAVKVEYEVHPFVVDTRSAMASTAPVVHQRAVKERRTEGDEPTTGAAASESSGNIRPGRSQKKGNAAKGLRQAEVVHEAVYETQCHTHSSLETHGVVVRWDDADHMTVWASTQSIFSARNEMADMFGLKNENVHVITEYLGGGFGSKFGANAPGTQIGKIAGELAKQAQRPVKLMMDRREEHLCTGNRPDSIQEIKLGAKKNGSLTAIHIKAHGSAGVGTGAGVGRNAFGIYSKCPNILVESADVFTHAGPGTAFRAPGHPQGAFAIESALDELAKKIDVDPIELRLKHDAHPVRRYQLELGAKRFEWAKKRKLAQELRKKGSRVRRGVGMAASIWGDYGRPGGIATVVVQKDGVVEMRNGIQDIGTGIGTVLGQVTADVFGRELSQVVVKIGDSELGPGTGSGGSKTTSAISPAVRNAAEKAKAQLTELAAKELGTKPPKVKWGAGGEVSFGRQKLSFEELCKKIDGEAIVATSGRPKTYGNHPMKYPGGDVYQIAGVQFAEVEVDTWTGIVNAKKMLAVHDCGRVMNALTVRSQINGGIVLGTGYALTEQRIMDRDLGVMLNANLDAYKPCGAKDCPDIDIVLTEVAAGNNSTGAIGIGEPATIPTAAAIANAVADAIGVHVRSLPITPGRVLDAMAKGGA
jgi:xanthine dehydrogenase YagR molybdenum-binding subunit